MTDKTKVKLSVCYDTGSTCYRTDCVAEKHVADNVIEQWRDASCKIVEFSGLINDIDGNIVTYAIERDSIKCVDIVEVNKL